MPVGGIIFAICYIKKIGMKTLLIISYMLWLQADSVQAQKIKPCDNWLTDFIQTEPKISDGTPINKYVAQKLMDEPQLKSMISCMVGLRIYVNCNGELSYDEQFYRNNPLMKAQCDALLQKTESILNGISHFSPGTIGHQPKDFIFKLVVKVKACISL
jgi:hypothetical protein